MMRRTRLDGIGWLAVALLAILLPTMSFMAWAARDHGLRAMASIASGLVRAWHYWACPLSITIGTVDCSRQVDGRNGWRSDRCFYP